MDCPNGHGLMTQGEDFWVCLKCGVKCIDTGSLQGSGAGAVSTGPFADILPRLPHALAVPLAESYVGT